MSASPRRDQTPAGLRSVSILVAVLAGALLACAMTDPRRHAAAAGGPKAVELLKKTLPAVPAPTHGTKPCVDSAMLAARTRDEQPLSVDGFDDVALGAAFKGTEPALSDPWRWLNSSSLYYVAKTAGVDPMNSSDAMALHRVLERGHVAIFRASVRIAPLIKSGAFTPGKYAGSLFIMNLQTQAALCHGSISAENSSDFVATDPAGKLLTPQELEEAAIADLRANFEAELSATLKAMGTGAQVEIGSRVRGK